MSNSFTDGFRFVFSGLPDRGGGTLGGWHFVSSKIVEHMEISGKAILVAVLIGVPLGMFLGHIHRFSFLAINISNLGRALPSLAVLAIFFPITGINQNTVIIALVILAAPPILTNSYVAIDQVDTDTVDAAKGMGMRPLQILLRVELPLALPLIFAGIRTSTVFVVATATLSGYFGGGGLGDIISNQASYRLAGVVGASYVLIVLAILSQIIFVLIEEAITPAALRRRRFRPTFIAPARGSRKGTGDDVAEPSPLEEQDTSLEQGSLTR
jgi:osmoprotectant transport system permease protein